MKRRMMLTRLTVLGLGVALGAQAFAQAPPATAPVTVAQPPLMLPPTPVVTQPAVTQPVPVVVPTATVAPAVAAAPLPPVEHGEYGYAMPSLYGPSGTLRVFNADSGPAGTFRIQLTGEAFKASDFLIAGDSNTRFGGRLQLGISPLDWLEIFASISGFSNDNAKGTPPLIQVQGDFNFGVKGCYRVTEYLCIGAMGALHFLTGAGDIAFTGKSTSAMLRLLATADLTRLQSRLPLRISFNFGGYIDNSDALLNPLYTAVQRYGLRINESSRIFLGLNVEAPVSRYITPFLEWSFEIPVGLPAVPSGVSDTGASAYPNILSLGARIFPWKQLSLLAAVDIGITSAGRPGVPAIPPWQVVFGIGWAFDSPPQKAESKIVEKIVTKEVVREKIVTKEVPVPTPVNAPPTTGWMIGAIVDSKTGQPVPDAAIRFLNQPASAVLSGREKGDFRAEALKPGKLQLRIEKDGYKSADFEVEIVAGKPTANSFPIDKAEVAKTAVLVGKLTDEDGKPLVGIVEVKGTHPGGADRAKSGASKKLATEPATGAFVGSFEAGEYNVAARSTGYLSKEKTITLNDKDRVVVDFALRKEPEKRMARLEGNKIIITKQVRFKKGSAKIVGKESFAILDEVVDILSRNPQIKKIKVEGHTDNTGGKKFNQKLSDKRSASVMEYLVKQGIGPSRLESQGFGQTRPLVPNTSKKNKAKNRRVEFIIQD